MRNAVMKKSRHGFTLLEMSVVLVILGLLIGAVIAGQHLVRSSQLRSVGADAQKYRAAISAFQIKFQAMPGDLANAESYWGSDAACPATPYNTLPKKETCNGDGNGKIALHDYEAMVLENFYEEFRAWQHLANAGLIEGAFIGASGPGAEEHAVVGVNVPESKVPGAGFTPAFVNGTILALYRGHILAFGGESGADTFQGILLPEEAYRMDLKMDDGKPSTGTVTTRDSIQQPGCSTTDVIATAEYDLTSVLPVCGLDFMMDSVLK